MLIILFSPTQAIVALLVGVITVWIVARFNSKQSRALRSLPRPKSTLTLLGNTLDLMKKQRHRIHDWFYDECMRNNGNPWLLTAIGRPPSIVLSKEEHFEDVLLHQFPIFGKGAAGSLIAKDVFGEGIFAVDGEKWSKQRKIACALFADRTMRDIMEVTIMECTKEFLALLQDASVNLKPLDFNHAIDALAMDVFTKIGFGVHPHCVQGGSGIDKEVLDAFLRCGQAIQYRVQQPMWLWQLKKALNIGLEKQLAKDIAIVDDTIYKIISISMTKRVSESVQNNSSPPRRTDLISLMLDRSSAFGDDNACGPNPQMIRDMALNTITAGRATTAQSLLWFFVSLNQYPEVLAKVQHELAEKIPELFSNKKTVPDKTDVQKLVYLEAALRESMRLHPAAPFNGRTANKDTKLRDGTVIPEGTRVVFPAYTAQRVPWIWGDDAMEYKPERWIDHDQKIKPVSPFKFLVFHGGPRMCLGVKLAMLEMKIVLAAILSKYTIQIQKNPHEVEYDISLSLPIKGELLANVHPLKNGTHMGQNVAHGG